MNDMKAKTGALLKEMAVLTGAVAIVAAGVYFFLVPSHTCALHSVRSGWLLYRPADAAESHNRNGPVV